MLDRIKFTIAVSALAFSMGCATTSDPNHDPLEPLNRDIYAFNDKVDHYIVGPIIVAYQAITPNLVQKGVSNFFDNLREIPTIANDLLQLKPGYAVQDTTRFIINSTFGLAGLIDVAEKIGVQRHKEDFGQTLYAWGMKDSTYLVLPFLGPSTIRDTIGLAVDYTLFTPYPHLHKSERNILLGLEALDQRARFYRHSKVLDALGIDEYAMVRNAYLQNRRFIGHDGQLPEEDLEDDPFPEGLEEDLDFAEDEIVE